MTESQRIENRKQLKQCFIDLAKRAEDLDEPALSPICLVIAGTIAEGSDELLATWLSEYARFRLDMFKKDKGL